MMLSNLPPVSNVLFMFGGLERQFLNGGLSGYLRICLFVLDIISKATYYSRIYTTNHQSNRVYQPEEFEATTRKNFLTLRQGSLHCTSSEPS